MSNTVEVRAPSEQSEVKFPLVVERYALIPNSGGAGRHRGGLGLERVVRARVPMTFNSHVERAHCKPWGLNGGGDATGNEVAIRIGSKWKTDFPNAKVLVAHLQPGDAFRMRSGGGGGYGSPLDRPIGDVEADAKQGYISIEAARDFYGVVLDPHSFVADRTATERLRSAMRKGLAAPASAESAMA